MTYLDLMNNVLRRMRETSVATVNANTYSSMVGDYINDAIEIVQQAYDWSVLRESESAVVADGISSLTLPTSSDDIEIKTAMNVTDRTFMEYRSKDWFNQHLTLASNVENGKPMYYTYDGLDASGNTQLKVFPPADGNKTLQFEVVKRKANLQFDTDTTFLPSRPIIHFAVALLARERGETGGTSATEHFAIAQRYLSDAIALDAHKHEEELTFRTV